MIGYFRKQIKGMNPALPNPNASCKVFASSVKIGTPENLLVPKDKIDFGTMNQAYSYFGFELTGSKRLIPNCYTIRNAFGDE